MTEAPANDLVVGLDLGGSSIKWAVVEDRPGTRNVIATGLHDIKETRRPRDVVDELSEVFQLISSRYGQSRRVGLGLPGMFDEGRGTPTLLPNFPASWVGYAVRDRLIAKIGQSVLLVNDAKAFSVAESNLGAGAGYHCVVTLVLGTGVGGGVVFDGVVWRGLGSAGELGHLTVSLDGPLCGCGARGCVEAYAGANAIVSNGGRPTVREVFEAASQGDPRASRAVSQAIDALGAGLASVFIVLAPDVFIIGGGVAGAGDQLVGPLVESIRSRVRVAAPGQIKVVEAELGRFSGAVGAALMAGGLR